MTGESFVPLNLPASPLLAEGGESFWQTSRITPVVPIPLLSER